jgi:hypothetical protein
LVRKDDDLLRMLKSRNAWRPNFGISGMGGPSLRVAHIALSPETGGAGLLKGADLKGLATI